MGIPGYGRQVIPKSAVRNPKSEMSQRLTMGSFLAKMKWATIPHNPNAASSCVGPEVS